MARNVHGLKENAAMPLRADEEQKKRCNKGMHSTTCVTSVLRSSHKW